MFVKFLTLFLLPPELKLLRFWMVKVLAPILLNSLVMEVLIDSIAVRIPTNAIIPKAMISVVRIVRSKLDFTELIEIRKFSFNRAPTFIEIFFIEI